MFCQFCGTNLGKKKQCDKCVEKKAALSFKPKLAKDYSDKEKIEEFDKLHASALRYFEGRKSGEIHEDSDDKHYTFSDVIGLLGKDVWKAINQF